MFLIHFEQIILSFLYDLFSFDINYTLVQTWFFLLNVLAIYRFQKMNKKSNKKLLQTSI